jgi:hypothetical protein
MIEPLTKYSAICGASIIEMLIRGPAGDLFAISARCGLFPAPE